MSRDPLSAEFPRVGTTELDWSDRAREDGWVLSHGQWQHYYRVDSFDDGDWIYMGDSGWDDTYLGFLPFDMRREAIRKYADLFSVPS